MEQQSNNDNGYNGYGGYAPLGGSTPQGAGGGTPNGSAPQQTGIPPRPDVRAKRDGNGLGLVSLLCGCAALSCFLLFVNVPLAIAAIVFGMIQLFSYKKKLIAYIGITTAALSLVLMIVGWVIILRGAATLDPATLEQFREQLEQQYELQGGQSL